MTVSIELTPDELWQAVSVGAHRRISCLFGRKTKQHYDSPTGDEWATEIESCCAEIAVAKHLGVYWSGGVFDGQRAAHDVDGRQVRHTAYDSGKLIIYPEDKPEEKFILVTGKAPHYVIRGWAFGSDAQGKGKNHQWWLEPIKKRSPSWWVPQTFLRTNGLEK